MTSLPRTSVRLLGPVAAGLLATGLLVGCSGDEPAPAASSSAPSTPSAAAEDVAENITEFSYAGEEGATALDLLLVHDPDAQVTGEGEMAYVTAIKGRAAVENEEFWALYVDGELASVGAGALETKDGQQVQWKLEEITQ